MGLVFMSCILDRETVINSNELSEYLLLEMSMNRYTVYECGINNVLAGLLRHYYNVAFNTFGYKGVNTYND